MTEKSNWIRDYGCGCIPEEEHYCKAADPKVWRDLDIGMTLAFDTEFLPRQRLAELEDESRQLGAWLREHFRGPFTWIALDCVTEPPDFGDEDPRAWGGR